MKPVSLFVFLFVVQQLNAQGFTQSPYQNFDLSGPITADFNGDGKSDVLGIQFGFSETGKIVLQTNNGTSPLAFTEKSLDPSFQSSGQPAAADLDGDKDIDVVFAKGGPAYKLYILWNDSLGNFTLDTLGVSGTNLLKVADIDNDMDLDIIGIDGKTALDLYINDGSQHFSKMNILSNSSNLEFFDLGDMDNDNDLDIVLGFDQFFGKQLVIYKNNGSNIFEEVILVSDDISGISDIRVDDLNSDGKQDIITITGFDCLGFLNNGNLMFEQKSLNVGSNGILNRILTGDYNGDGRKDIILGYNSAGLRWYKNISNQTLEFSAQNVGGVSPVFSIVNCDLDGDHDTDIVVSNGEFWWYENGIVQEPVSTTTFSKEAIHVFPNPFQDFIQVTNTGNELYKIGITDSNGQPVYGPEQAPGLIRLPHLIPGMYFLHFTDTNTGQTRSVPVFKGD